MEIGLALVENISLTGMVRGYSSLLSTRQVIDKYTSSHHEYLEEMRYLTTDNIEKIIKLYIYFYRFWDIHMHSNQQKWTS